MRPSSKCPHAPRCSRRLCLNADGRRGIPATANAVNAPVLVRYLKQSGDPLFAFFAAAFAAMAVNQTGLSDVDPAAASTTESA